jgi:hypothetical protein
MAIPVYSGPTVAPTITQAPRVSPGMSQNNLGALAEGVRGAVSDIAKAQMEADQLRVQSEHTPFATEVNGLIVEAEQIPRANVRDPKAYGGKENQSFLDRYLERFEETRTKYAEKLSPRQREVFQRVSEREKNLMLERLQRHEAKQIHLANIDNFKSQQALLMDSLSKFAVDKDGQIDGRALKTFKADLLDNITRQGKYEGLPVEDVLVEARSAVNTLVIENMLALKNEIGAKTFFDLNKDEIDGKKKIELEKRFTEIQRVNDISKLSLKDWQELKPKIVGGVIDESGFQARADERWPDDLENRNLYMAQINKYISNVEQDFNRKKEVIEAHYWDAWLNGTLADYKKSSEWQQAQAPEFGDFRMELLERHENLNRARAAQISPEEEVRRYATYKALLDNPERLASMPDSVVQSFTGILGPKIVKDLLDDKRKAKGNLDELKNVTLANINFVALAKEFGVIPSTQSKLNQKQMATIGKLKEIATGQIKAAQIGGKKVLDWEEKEKIVKGLLVQVKSGERFLPWGDDPTKPSFEVPISSQERTEAIRYLVKAGAYKNETEQGARERNEQNIQTLVFRMRSKKAEGNR